MEKYTHGPELVYNLGEEAGKVYAWSMACVKFVCMINTAVCAELFMLRGSLATLAPLSCLFSIVNVFQVVDQVVQAHVIGV